MQGFFDTLYVCMFHRWRKLTFSDYKAAFRDLLFLHDVDYFTDLKEFNEFKNIKRTVRNKNRRKNGRINETKIFISNVQISNKFQELTGTY